MSKLIQFIKQLLAPGVDECQPAEIRVLLHSNGKIYVDEQSFCKSGAVKRQIAALRQSTKQT